MHVSVHQITYKNRLTFELLDIAQQEHVGVLHLQVKFDCLQQNSL